MALGVEMMTPVPASIARPLVDSMRGHSVVKDDRARQVFPGVRLLGYREAVELSLEALHPDRLEPVWRASRVPVKILKHEGFFIDHRRLPLDAPVERVYRVITDMGGVRGWYFANWMWKLRGLIDRVLGGAGLRGRGETLEAGGVVDFYRVEALDQTRLLLKADLKAPGQGWMEWRVEGGGGEDVILTQTGFFAPRGLPGFTYWYLLGPFHRWVFHGLIRAIARRSQA
jgi:hypothetical protein